MIWEVLFLISFLVNIIFVFYTKWLLRNYASTIEDIYKINESILDFTEHVKEVYELEMFYGDETLHSLMQHAKQIAFEIEELDLIIKNDEDSEEEKEED